MTEYSLPDELYKGNSARHWHHKANAYGNCIMNCWDLIRKSGLRFDGTSLVDVVDEMLNKLKQNTKERNMKIISEKYYLKPSYKKDYDEVSKETYLEAERMAGFFPKIPGEAATDHFGNGQIEGKCEIEYEFEEE